MGTVLNNTAHRSQRPDWIRAIDIPKELKSDAVVPRWTARYSWSESNLLEIKSSLFNEDVIYGGESRLPLICDQTLQASTERCLQIWLREGWVFSLPTLRSGYEPYWAFLVVQLIKNLPSMQKILVQFLGWEDSPGEGIGYPIPLQCSWASLVA